MVEEIGKLEPRTSARRKSKKSARRVIDPQELKPATLPPIEFAKFFLDPPLVGDEKKEDFYKFFSAIGAAINPPDIIAWLLTWDLACLSWEIKRERGVKADIIRSAQLLATARLLDGIRQFEQDPVAELDVAELGQDGSEVRRFATEVAAELTNAGFTASDVMAQAYIQSAAYIDTIDRRIASYENRRMAVMRALEDYDERLARKLDVAQNIVQPN